MFKASLVLINLLIAISVSSESISQSQKEFVTLEREYMSCLVGSSSFAQVSRDWEEAKSSLAKKTYQKMKEQHSLLACSKSKLDLLKDPELIRKLDKMYLYDNKKLEQIRLSVNKYFCIF